MFLLVQFDKHELCENSNERLHKNRFKKNSHAVVFCIF